MSTPAVHHRLPRRRRHDQLRRDRPAHAGDGDPTPTAGRDRLLLLDDQRRGIAVAVAGHISPTTCSRSSNASRAAPPTAAAPAASSSPACAPTASDEATTPRAADVDRWLEMSDIAEQAGVELLEWFVIGGDVTCRAISWVSHLAGELPALRRSQAQSGLAQALQQLAARHHLGAAGDQRRPELLGHVVVVTLEAAPGMAGLGESVQLLERGVADEVAPAPAAEPPARLVDQDRHPTRLAH